MFYGYLASVWQHFPFSQNSLRKTKFGPVHIVPESVGCNDLFPLVSKVISLLILQWILTVTEHHLFVHCISSQEQH